MQLRRLKQEDAQLMLEWMHDDIVIRDLRDDFINKSIDDCIEFIDASYSATNIHLAVTNDEDEYMGTISLKKIENGTAEFSMVVRNKAMGRGYSWYGIKEMIDYAFNELGLESVYWCVPRKNKRAIRFFDKHNFHENVDVPQYIFDRYKDIDNLKWYSVLKGDDINIRESGVGCKVIRSKTITTFEAGEL